MASLKMRQYNAPALKLGQRGRFLGILPEPQVDRKTNEEEQLVYLEEEEEEVEEKLVY